MILTCSESVVTITSVIYLELIAFFIEKYIKGFYPIILIFLFGIPFEPALAGITANIFIIKPLFFF